MEALDKKKMYWKHKKKNFQQLSLKLEFFSFWRYNIKDEADHENHDTMRIVYLPKIPYVQLINTNVGERKYTRFFISQFIPSIRF